MTQKEKKQHSACVSVCEWKREKERERCGMWGDNQTAGLQLCFIVRDVWD